MSREIFRVSQEAQWFKIFNDFFNRRNQVTTGFNAICFFQLTSHINAAKGKHAAAALLKCDLYSFPRFHRLIDCR